jgi:hypothetical protein
MLARVKATPGTLQEGGASFATTHWSVVAQSALTDVPEAANALARLCKRKKSFYSVFLRDLCGWLGSLDARE